MCDNPRMRAGRLRVCCGVAVLLAGIMPVVLTAQNTRRQEIVPGKLLVASRGLSDPNFAETVVLLVRSDEDGVVGLVVNRRTKVPISRALEELKGAKDVSDPIYAGGPVGRAGILALLRSRTRIEGAEHIVGDVYLATKAALLERTLASGSHPDTFRIYAGYAGWTAKQLAGEVELGAWYIFAGDPGVVFAARPELVWSRLIERTEQHVAWLAQPRP